MSASVDVLNKATGCEVSARGPSSYSHRATIRPVAEALFVGFISSVMGLNPYSASA